MARPEAVRQHPAKGRPALIATAVLCLPSFWLPMCYVVDSMMDRFVRSFSGWVEDRLVSITDAWVVDRLFAYLIGGSFVTLWLAAIVGVANTARAGVFPGLRKLTLVLLVTTLLAQLATCTLSVAYFGH